MMINAKKILAVLFLVVLTPLTATAGLDNLFNKITGRSPSVTLNVLLIDDTTSITQADHELYRKAASAVISSIKLGDRTVIARISDASLGSFRVELDLATQGTGIHFDDKTSINKAHAALQLVVDKIISTTTNGNATRLMDTFLALNPLISEARANNQSIKVVVLSDAIEETERFNMKNPRQLTNVFVKKMLDAKEKAKLMPDMTGASILFVGAGGSTTENAKAGELFWRDYIKRSHGNVTFYGRTIPSL